MVYPPWRSALSKRHTVYNTRVNVISFKPTTKNDHHGADFHEVTYVQKNYAQVAE